MAKILPVPGLTVLGMALLAGCASAPSPQQKPAEMATAPAAADNTQVFVEQPDGTLKHVPSGFLFPAKLGSFERGSIDRNAKGDDVAVSYFDDFSQIIATIDVYPTHGKPLAKEFAWRQDEISNVYLNVKLVSTSSVAVTPKKFAAMQATYTLVFPEETRLMRSELLVGQQGGWFIEYRISYPAANHDTAMPKVKALEQMFAWPSDIRPAPGGQCDCRVFDAPKGKI